ncbi:MAG: hypothetical protein CENE_00006 [Candidatus Celerinatantimonas neptuna]|nr:MAG: hypothetical protein CENE_00006 [Candidatus Celerinatantimonas neptuna]
MQPIQSLNSVTRYAVEGWQTEVTKELIGKRIASYYHKMQLNHQPDSQDDDLLKVPCPANDHDNMQRLWRYLLKDTVPAKANILDLLPAIIAALPIQRATEALNVFLNPLGYSVAHIGSGECSVSRDLLLANFAKEGSEAMQAVLKLGPEPTIEQLCACYKEVQESKGTHGPLLDYLELRIALHSAA